MSKNKLFLLLALSVIFIIGFTLFLGKVTRGKTNVYNATIPSSKINVSLGTADNNTAVVAVAKGNSRINFETQIQGVTLEKESDNFVYKDEKEEMEIRYHAIPKGFKEEIIINKPSQTNKFDVKVTLKDAVVKKNLDDQPVILDKNGKYQFHFQKPYAEDAKGEKTYALSYTLNDSDPENLTLTLLIDNSWLTDPQRVYPIIIDPTIIDDESQANLAKWEELTYKRNRTSKTYINTEVAGRYSWDGTLDSIHYESIPGSGNYDTSINMTPVETKTAAFDGYEITQNGWYYRLGNPADKGQDGWVGFGGRKGEKWFNFRLEQVGYFEWNSKSFDDIGGTINYDRNNLSTKVNTLRFGPNNEQLPIGSVLDWKNLWTTPNGGTLGIRWRVNGDALKEEMIIDQPARDYVATNKAPKTKKADTYFGFVFKIDWDNIPKIKRAGVEKNKRDSNLDLADDGKQIEFKDESDRLLAFMPISDAWINDETGAEIEGSRVGLKKRFYNQNGKTYLLVGLRTDILETMPQGTLIIDPTVDYQVSSGPNDGYSCTGTYGFATNGSVIRVGYHDTGGYWNSSDGFTLFDGVSGLGGKQIDVAYYSLYGYTSISTTPLTKLYVVKAASPTAPTSAAEFDALSLSTAGTDFDGVLTDATWNNSPSFVTPLQELVDSYTPTAILVVHKDDGSAVGTNSQRFYQYDDLSSTGPKLHIEYSDAPTPTPASPPGMKFDGVKMEGVKIN